MAKLRDDNANLGLLTCFTGKLSSKEALLPNGNLKESELRVSMTLAILDKSIPAPHH